MRLSRDGTVTFKDTAGGSLGDVRGDSSVPPAGTGGERRADAWRAANAPRFGGRPVGLLLRLRYGPRASALMRRLRALRHRLG